MKTTLQISAVKYLNTQPYIYGLEGGSGRDIWNLTLDTPADCARKLSDNKVDIGLVPVAAIPQLIDYRPVTEWGIGADGAVQSVMLLSKVRIEAVKAVYLDYQSKTSNALLRILLKEYFGQDLTLLDSREGYEQGIKNEVAGLVIGDRALKMKSQYPYSYDLAQIWKEMTGLPFVFARWVASERVTKEIEVALEQAFEDGMARRQEIANKVELAYPNSDIKSYLQNDIKYKLGPSYWQGLALFQEKHQNTINLLTQQTYES